MNCHLIVAAAESLCQKTGAAEKLVERKLVE